MKFMAFLHQLACDTLNRHARDPSYQHEICEGEIIIGLVPGENAGALRRGVT